MAFTSICMSVSKTDCKSMNKNSGITDQERRVMEKCVFVWMMGKKKALFLHTSESYLCFWFWRWFKKLYRIFFFVIVGFHFALTKNDVIFILFWWWPFEISSTICFLLFVEAELNGIAIKTLFWRICMCGLGHRHHKGISWRLLAAFVGTSPVLAWGQSGQSPQKNIEKNKLEIMGKQ